MQIEGVSIVPLKRIEDERGAVMHMLRSDAPHFKQFGEVYFSLVKPGVIKAWKYHERLHQNMAVPHGEIRLVIYDARQESLTHGQIQIIDFGAKNYVLVQMPPNVWYGFQAISDQAAILANCTSEVHDPKESKSLPMETNQIPFNWKI